MQVVLENFDSILLKQRDALNLKAIAAAASTQNVDYEVYACSLGIDAASITPNAQTKFEEENVDKRVYRMSKSALQLMKTTKKASDIPIPTTRISAEHNLLQLKDVPGFIEQIIKIDTKMWKWRNSDVTCEQYDGFNMVHAHKTYHLLAECARLKEQNARPFIAIGVERVGEGKKSPVLLSDECFNLYQVTAPVDTKQ